MDKRIRDYVFSQKASCGWVIADAKTAQNLTDRWAHATEASANFNASVRETKVLLTEQFHHLFTIEINGETLIGGAQCRKALAPRMEMILGFQPARLRFVDSFEEPDEPAPTARTGNFAYA